MTPGDVERLFTDWTVRGDIFARAALDHEWALAIEALLNERAAVRESVEVLRDEVHSLAARVRAVRAIHRRVETVATRSDYCGRCGGSWPCEVIRVLGE